MKNWKQRNRPVCLEKRFEFVSYDTTREFLEKLGIYSEKTNLYPDISFGKTYVNITIRPEDDSSEAKISSAEQKAASDIDLIYLDN